MGNTFNWFIRLSRLNFLLQKRFKNFIESLFYRSLVHKSWCCVGDANTMVKRVKATSVECAKQRNGIYKELISTREVNKSDLFELCVLLLSERISGRPEQVGREISTSPNWKPKTSLSHEWDFHPYWQRCRENKIKWTFLTSFEIYQCVDGVRRGGWWTYHHQHRHYLHSSGSEEKKNMEKENVLRGDESEQYALG